MALSLNRAMILGNSARPAEVRFTNAGTKVANFSVATTNRWKDKAGAVQEQTTWHNITAWGALADICEQVVQKGTRVYVDGSMLTENYQAKDGSQRTKTYIKADQVISMASGKDRADAGLDPSVHAPSPVTVRDNRQPWEEDGMPF